MDTTNGSSSSSSSSRKGKKSNVSSENSKARKQPQRGLGVAQLEKIRILHSQLHHHHQPPPPYFNYNEDPRLLQTPSYSHNSYTFQPHTMNISEYERSNIRYEDSHQPNRWQHGNVNHYSPPQTNTTQPYLNLYDTQEIGMHRSDSLDLESSKTQEPDLELRLSLY
ncbi:protein SPEAR3-like [Vicia villosa]|uniref:protein SPEAR3-like n=1 Tax=Vicia villosa TaxID=3911 RepID=UPI00273AC4C6|nr:protein SPEAR3-like [Vicia villosa]